MTPRVRDFPISQFTPDEQRDLLGRLWDHLLESNQMPPIPDWHAAILEHRLREADENPNDCVTLQDFLHEISQKCR